LGEGSGQSENASKFNKIVDFPAIVTATTHSPWQRHILFFRDRRKSTAIVKCRFAKMPGILLGGPVFRSQAASRGVSMTESYSDTWKDAKEQALKALGKKAKVSDGGLTSEIDGLNAARKGWGPQWGDLIDTAEEIQGRSEGLSTLLGQLQAKVAKDDFGLDNSNKDDQKKIAQAQDLLVDALKDMSKRCKSDLKTATEFLSGLRSLRVSFYE
jgi:uncharacterized phage infection (PIP) family protein YhgE